jgi:PAS domain S-box-containing protein
MSSELDLERIIEVLTGFMRGEFDDRLPVESPDSKVDALHAGINTLGAQVDALLRKSAEREQFVRGIIDALAASVAVIDATGEIVMTSRGWEEFATNAGQQAAPKGNYIEVCRRAGADETVAGLSAVLAGDRDRYREEYRCRFPTSDRWFLMTATPLAGGFAVVVHEDVTDVHLAGRQLRESEQRLRLALEASGMGTWEYRREERAAVWDEAAARLLGYDADDLSRMTYDGFAELVHPDDRERFVAAVEGYLSGTDDRFAGEFRLRTGRGEYRWIRALGRGVEKDERGPVRMLGTFADVTEQKARENKLEASVNEKQVLLRELHHRVKNNLQVVGSLLYFAQKSVESPSGREAIAECRSRVQAMGLVHDQLLGSASVRAVDVGEHAAAIARDVVAAHDPRIDVSSSVEHVFVPPTLALPVGLIVTELTLNSVKHAFGDRTTGSIALRLESHDETLVLELEDDGVGLPDNAFGEDPQSFGLRMVELLVDQVDGQIELLNGEGTSVRVRIPLPEGAMVTTDGGL